MSLTAVPILPQARRTAADARAAAATTCTACHNHSRTGTDAIALSAKGAKSTRTTSDRSLLRWQRRDHTDEVTVTVTVAEELALAVPVMLKAAKLPLLAVVLRTREKLLTVERSGTSNEARRVGVDGEGVGGVAVAVSICHLRRHGGACAAVVACVAPCLAVPHVRNDVGRR